MHITWKDHTATVWVKLLSQSIIKSNERFRIVYCWMQEFTGVLPSSVQIHTHQWCSVVAMNDTIWIQNWYHFKYKMLSQFYSYRVIRDEEFYAALDHILRICLTWVDSRCEKEVLFVFWFSNFLFLILSILLQVLVLIVFWNKCWICWHIWLSLILLIHFGIFLLFILWQE